MNTTAVVPVPRSTALLYCAVMLRALLTQRIKEKALELGFERVGIAPVEDVPDEKLLSWLERDYHGEMQYMAGGVEKRLDPSLILKGVKTVLSVALNYYHPYPLPYHDPASGVVSRYAAGDDYHEVLWPKLKTLLDQIEELCPGAEGRIYVDTGPVMDKHWAARSGIGWIGKNANLIAGKKLGSWFFIGEILLNQELDPDDPGRDHCGSCRRCLDECPTDAIVEPYVVDSRLCISYLTIEVKEDIPEERRRGNRNLIFGCDICQDVCPWNRRVEESREPAFAPREALRHPLLKELAGLTENDFRSLFRKSPVKRAKWRGLMRNTAVAMGNSRSQEFVPELTRLLHSPDPMVRRHAAWGLKEIAGDQARKALIECLGIETDGPTRQALEKLVGER